MRNRILAILFCLAGPVWHFVSEPAWHWFWEFVRSGFYDRGLRMTAPFIDSITSSITIDRLMNWGPTLVLPAFGIWLIWKTKPTIQKEESLNKQVHAPKIEICFRPCAPYEISEIINGRVKSTVRIGIRNSGGSPISNCKIYIESVSPPPIHVGLFPALLDGGSFVLRHDDPEKLIDIAYHFDHVNKYRFSTPLGGYIGAETLNYMSESEQRKFVIKFVATECQKSAMFKILVDETKKLRLQYIGDAG